MWETPYRHHHYNPMMCFKPKKQTSNSREEKEKHFPTSFRIRHGPNWSRRCIFNIQETNDKRSTSYTITVIMLMEWHLKNSAKLTNCEGVTKMKGGGGMFCSNQSNKNCNKTTHPLVSPSIRALDQHYAIPLCTEECS